MRLVFMGTPEFAVDALDALIREGHDVVAVVTATDKPGGRGRKEVLSSEVARYARARDLVLLQPERLRDPVFLESLARLEAELFVVVAFRMLPEVIWRMPPKGTINLHGSLLPAYRGAAPIHWSILNGERETGVTVFFLRQEIDTGDVIWREHIPIGPEETTGSLHDRMKAIGARALSRAVAHIQAGDHSRSPQPAVAPSHAPKIHPHLAAIDPSWPAEKVRRWVAGMNPHPVAWAVLDERKLKIYRVTLHPIQPGDLPGQWIVAYPRLFLVVADGRVSLEDVQMEGRKRMDIREFLHGLNRPDGLAGICPSPSPTAEPS